MIEFVPTIAAADPTPAAIADWLKVVFYLSGGVLAVVVLVKQFSSKPPAGDLDKGLAALNSKVDAELKRVAEQIVSIMEQFGQLTNVVNQRESHAVKRREEFREEDRAIRKVIDDQVSSLYREINPLKVQQARFEGTMEQIKSSLNLIQKTQEHILEKLP